MAFLEIPTRSDLKHYEFQIDLENITYTLEFGWNQRAERWYMAIYNATGDLLLGDVILLTNVPLLDQYIDENLPPGRFILIDESGENKNPGENDLGNDVKLFYDESTG